jgi:hypothetical protein
MIPIILEVMDAVHMMSTLIARAIRSQDQFPITTTTPVMQHNSPKHGGGILMQDSEGPDLRSSPKVILARRCKACGCYVCDYIRVRETPILCM